MATPSLDDIRREIDGIDDAILELLIRRFEATARVRATKSGDGSIAMSPLRPAREAVMLRRLIASGSGKVPAQVLVRLWRVILSASTQAQAPIALHVVGQPSDDPSLRVVLSEHFCGMGVVDHAGPRAALEALASHRSDLAVLAPQSDWASVFPFVAGSGVGVISSLPAIGSGTPSLLVFGHADPQPSGNDETVVIARAPFPAGTVLWQVSSGGLTAAGLPGFLSDADPILSGLSTGGSRLMIAGRLPRPIEVSP